MHVWVATLAGAAANTWWPAPPFDDNGAFGGIDPAAMARDPIRNVEVPGGRLRQIPGMAASVFSGQFREDRFMMWNFFSDMRSEPPRALLYNGVFLEIGAFDGAACTPANKTAGQPFVPGISNTYVFEKELGWHGLLIEGGGANFVKLSKNRLRHARSGALAHIFANASGNSIGVAGNDGRNLLIESAVARTEGIVFFSEGNAVGGLVDGSDAEGTAYRKSWGAGRQKLHQVRAMPMRKLLSTFAPSLRHIDMISLDIEGSELGFLETFPWSSRSGGGVSVGVIVVEITVHQTEIAALVPRVTDGEIQVYHRKGGNLYFANVSYLTALHGGGI